MSRRAVGLLASIAGLACALAGLAHFLAGRPIEGAVFVVAAAAWNIYGEVVQR